MTKSIVKGKSFERIIAKLITKWTGYQWNRVPCSGGFATARRSIDRRFQGDIFTDNDYFADLVIECKFSKGRITLEDITNKKSKFWEWVKQTKEEAGDKDWILFFKTNFGQIFAVFEENKKNWFPGHLDKMLVVWPTNKDAVPLGIYLCLD